MYSNYLILCCFNIWAIILFTMYGNLHLIQVIHSKSLKILLFNTHIYVQQVTCDFRTWLRGVARRRARWITWELTIFESYSQSIVCRLSAQGTDSKGEFRGFDHWNEVLTPTIISCWRTILVVWKRFQQAPEVIFPHRVPDKYEKVVKK